jgi:phosphatidyl-myo-inositol dimannoside synthase
MKVLVLVHESFGGRGGIAKFNRDFLDALSSSSGLSEIIVAQRDRYEPREASSTKITYLPPAGGFIRYGLRVLFYTLRHPDIDLIVCGHMNLAPLAYLAGRLNSHRTWAVIHGIDAWQPHRRSYTNEAMRRMSLVLSVSELTKGRFLRWAKIPADRVKVLPNCVDMNYFFPSPPSSALTAKYGLGDGPLLVTVARLEATERYKGIDDIIDVLPQLLRERPTLRYMIVGDGTDRERLQEKVALSGLQQHVLFTGFVVEEQKRDIYRAADAFVLAGWKEGFGIVFLEAMACGTPAIGSTRDGSVEPLGHGTMGILVDPANKNDLIRGVLEALARPRGRPVGLDVFSKENFTKRLHQLIEQK